MKAGNNFLFRAGRSCRESLSGNTAGIAGFTLLEVMIAIAILSGVVLTAICSYNYHLGLVSRDREDTTAVLLARAKLEEPGFASQESKQGTFAPDRPDVTWKVTSETTELPGLARMTLTVAWSGGRKSRSLVQYVRK